MTETIWRICEWNRLRVIALHKEKHKQNSWFISADSEGEISSVIGSSPSLCVSLSIERKTYLLYAFIWMKARELGKQKPKANTYGVSLSLSLSHGWMDDFLFPSYSLWKKPDDVAYWDDINTECLMCEWHRSHCMHGGTEKRSRSQGSWIFNACFMHTQRASAAFSRWMDGKTGTCGRGSNGNKVE